MSPLSRESCARTSSGASLWTAALVALVLVPVMSRAQAVTPKALINDATVTGGAASQEAAIATALGFEVTVVSDATWGGYTTEDFAQYDLLIAGDPSCGTLPPGLIATAPVYGPVVMGLAGGRTLAGNRVLVAADPVFHDFGDYTSPDARGTIIREGIAFAAKEPGRTGMYFASHCATHPEPGQFAEILSILDHLTEGSGDWEINVAPPCGGSVSLIASHPSFVDLTTASLEGWNCSAHQSFPTFPTDWSALAVATDTTSRPTCGIDPNTAMNACGEAYILIAGVGIVVRSGSISLSPAEATNPVDTDHTVTAHVTSGNAPLAGQVVTFSVTGQNAGALGICMPAGCVTNASGDVSFTYHGHNGPGDDTIKASFTDARGSLQSATAQKHWEEVPEEPDLLEIGSVPDIKVKATSKSGAAVNYAKPVATDGDDVAPPPVVICTPPSGSLFPVGTTTVTCTATDPDNTPSEPSEVSTTFRVTVTPFSTSQCRERHDHDDDWKDDGGYHWKPKPHESRDYRKDYDRDYRRDDRRSGYSKDRDDPKESWWDRAVKTWHSWRD